MVIAILLKAAGDRALTFVGVTSTYAVRAYGALRLFPTWTVLSREGVKTGMVFRFLHLPVAILGYGNRSTPITCALT